jgi:hypothetical protein
LRPPNSLALATQDVAEETNMAAGEGGGISLPCLEEEPEAREEAVVLATGRPEAAAAEVTAAIREDVV